jgi:formylglycine-generating enzyme required for sulfatase activity/class 3 adenylate cyclase
MAGESSTHLTQGTRRLAAIMSADIAGYSRHMGLDEEGTHSRVTRYRRDIIEPTVAEHNGHIVKHMGDGFLAIFDSPLEATRCAIVIQQNISARNTAIPKVNWLQYRIGINLGDVIEQEDDIYGDGVNIAARLQTAAEPGGVNISGGVYEQVKNKMVCGYKSLGDERLKNITDPVRIYKVLPDPASVERARPVSRFVRFTLPVLGLCGFAFIAGLFFATRNVTPRTTVATATVAPQTELPPGVSASAGPAPAASSPQTQVAVAAPPAAIQAPGPPPINDGVRDCSQCPEMVKVPGGTFDMGSTEDFSEKPVHQAAILPFAISRAPVTVREWRACLAEKSCVYEPTGADVEPVHNVSWDDAQQYVAWLAQTTSKPYRLPNEAEWEYAARAGTKTPYWWGAKLVPGSANCKGCGEPYDPAKPIKVGSFKANPFGLLDMGGNIEEWVSDCWHPTYHGAPRTGTWDSPNCRERVLRGGSWKSEPDDIRVSSRSHYEASVRYPTHGFRVAISTR